jgi:hypothetical protein
VLVGEETLELRRKEKGALIPPIEKWFLSEPIPNKPELALAAVKHREGKHTVEFFDGVNDTPLLYGREEYLGIAGTHERVAKFFELFPEIQEIEDLTVENRYEST